jgi:hypothetical protein
MSEEYTVYGVALRGEELWAATSAGLWQHAGGVWRQWRVGAAGGPPGRVDGRLWVDASDRLWVFTGNGPVVYAGDGWRQVTVTRSDQGGAAWGLANEWLRTTWLDERGWLWVRQWNGEVGYIDTTATLEG